jgi:predicted HAD superfamily Cof-like phosphohydrolase
MEKDMSKDWFKDIEDMHKKYGVDQWMGEKLMECNTETLRKFIEFRMAFLKEELDETNLAVQNNDPEEIVDGLIDLCVVAIGTLEAFGVDAHKAWDTVLEANMNKEVGEKAERPNPLGLPDLVKPEGWKSPSHEGNHGCLDYTF